MAPHVRVEPAAPSTPEGAVEPAAPSNPEGAVVPAAPSTPGGAFEPAARSNPEGAFVPVAYPVASYPVACSPMPYPVPYPVACPVACSPMPPVANPQQQQQQLHVPDGWHGDDLGQLHGPDGWHWDDPGQPRAEVRVQVGGHAHPHALLVRRRVVEQLERRALDAERSLEEHRQKLQEATEATARATTLALAAHKQERDRWTQVLGAITETMLHDGGQLPGDQAHAQPGSAAGAGGEEALLHDDGQLAGDHEHLDLDYVDWHLSSGHADADGENETASMASTRAPSTSCNSRKKKNKSARRAAARLRGDRADMLAIEEQGYESWLEEFQDSDAPPTSPRRDPLSATSATGPAPMGPMASDPATSATGAAATLFSATSATGPAATLSSAASVTGPAPMGPMASDSATSTTGPAATLSSATSATAPAATLFSTILAFDAQEFCRASGGVA